MLGLVLFTVGFIYYFRRQAWNAHTEINSNYRNKNKKLPDPKNSKGGLFTFKNLMKKISNGNKDSKVHAGNGGGNEDENDGNGEHEISRGELNDIEEAYNYPNNNDNENDDNDVLIPKLAKTIQTNHDEIDKQLIDQNTLLNNLQDTLRKEVDDLKSFLSSSNTHNTDDNNNNNDKNSIKTKKLISLLNQLKNDTNNRKFYEKNVDSTEKKSAQLLRNLMRLLTQGPQIMAEEIVEQISLQIFDKIVLEKNDNEDTDYDENNNENNNKIKSKKTLCLSFTLQTLYYELDQLKLYVSTYVLPSVTDEVRRKQIAETSFQNNLNNIINCSLSPLVLEQISICRDQELSVDKTSDGVNHIYEVFVQRTPVFVTAMNSEVEVSNIRKYNEI